MRKILCCLLLPALCWLFPQVAKAQTADFAASPSAACSSPNGCNSFNVTIGGVVFVFTHTNPDAGGSMQWLASGGGNGGSMDILSGADPDGDTEVVAIRRQDGGDFGFNSIYVQNDQSGTVTVQGYKGNAAVGSPQTRVMESKGNLNFGGIGVDEVRLTSADFFMVSFDDFSVTLCTTPVPSFTFGQACAGQPVNFTDASASVASDATYLWEFGDGITSTTKGSVIHTYVNQGSFTVKLTISQGSCGAALSRTVPVQPVLTKPVITTGACIGITTIGGTSINPNGTTITVFKGATAIGAGTVSGGNWSASVTSFAAGDLITAVATASDKCSSAASDAVVAATSYTYYLDGDNDGFGSPSGAQVSCAGTPPVGYVTNSTDCNDGNNAVWRTATFYTDQDGDSYTTGNGVSLCYGNTTPAGYSVSRSAADDCNDADNTQWQSASLYVDGDGDGYTAGQQTTCYGSSIPAGYSATSLGTDCNDNNPTLTQALRYFRDLDGDGFGNPAVDGYFCSLTPPDGYAFNGFDCDDTRTTYADADGDGFGSHEKASCGVDNNTDCNDTKALYQDLDGDGYGSSVKVDCGGVENSGDCNDADAGEKPGQTWYTDADGDGYAAGAPVVQCRRPANGKLAGELLATTGDCNDNDNAVWRTETFFRDADGDGQTAGDGVSLCYGTITPEGYSTAKSESDDCNDADASQRFAFLFYTDADGDGVGAGAPLSVCAANAATPPTGYSTTNTDCDDANNSVWQSILLFIDADGDGYDGGAAPVCYGSSVPAGYSAASLGADCNDNDNAIWQSATLYTDGDGDTYTTGNGQAVCYGAFVPTGFRASRSAADDCNDGHASVYPGATDTPDNGVDEDCDGADLRTWYEDADGDGFGNPASPTTSNTQPAGFVTDNSDCDDTRATYQDSDGDGFGSATKAACGVANNADCNDAVVLYFDNDSDGFGSTIKVACGGVTNNADCDDTQVRFQDNDGDTYGSAVKVACSGVTSNTDCNDSDATVYPGAAEVPDGKDNDCSGTADDGPAVAFYLDKDGDSFGNAKVMVTSSRPVPGYVTNSLDCDDNYPSYEDKDNDGWGTTKLIPCGWIRRSGDCNDNDRRISSPRTWYRDADGDKFGNPLNTVVVCQADPPAGYTSNNTDCDDANPLLNLGKTYYRDADGDGFGDLKTTITSCSTGVPAGYMANSLDCDDTKATYTDNDGDGYGAGPKMPCGVASNTDCNDADKNIQGQQVFYQDLDSDGFGNPAVFINYCGSTPPVGYITNNQDCDDTNIRYQDQDGDGFGTTTRVPCGGVVNSSDCDDTKVTYLDSDGDSYGTGTPTACGTSANNEDCNDDDATQHSLTTWYQDLDGDGFGNPAVTTQSCSATAPTGYAANNQDCDDSKVTYQDLDGDGFGSPVKQPCSSVTNHTDCDDTKVLYLDNDGDGFGSSTKVACGGVANNLDCDDTGATYTDSDADGFGAGPKTPCGVATNTDCNDADNTVYPAAAEAQDGKDNNCNGQTDEGFITLWYRDKDGDGFGNAKVFVSSPIQPAGYVTNSLDCDDNYPSYEDKDNDGWGTTKLIPCGWIRRSGDCNDNDRRISSPRTWYRDADGDKFGNPLNTVVVCQADPPAGYTSNNTDCDDANPLIRACPLVTTAIKEEKAGIPTPTAFTLSAFPNPFSRNTAVQYTVPVRARVELRLYNAVGSEVALLFSGEQKPGTYMQEVKSLRLSQGTYICRLMATVNGKVVIETQKLVKTE